MNKCSKKLGINFDLKFSDIQSVNPSFDSAKIAIAYAGRNRNMSSISKEAFEAALPTIKNVPLVGRYIEDEDDFGAHDIRVVVKGDEFDVQNATVPFGVIPESASQWWEEITEEDGTVRDYLFTDCLLWKRQPGYKCLANQNKWHQSMEIDLNKYLVDQDGYCVIEDFTYTAFCILGNSVEPCFESASVQLTSDAAVSVYKQQFSLMLDDLKREFGAKEVAFNSKEENTMKMTNEVREAILAEFNIKLEDLSFELTDDMTEEELREKLTNENKGPEPTPEIDPAEKNNSDEIEEVDVQDLKGDVADLPIDAQETPIIDNPVDAGSVQQSYAATYGQKRDAIRNALPYGENVCSWLMDFDDVYAYFEVTTYTEDSYEENNYRAKYIYDSQTMTASISDQEPIVCRWLTIEENAKIDADRDLLAELQAFKAEHLAAEHRAAVDAALEEFADMNGNEEFEALKEIAYELETIEALKKECYAIKGKFSYSKPEKATKTNVKVPIAVVEKKSDPVGDLFAVYGKK